MFGLKIFTPQTELTAKFFSFKEERAVNFTDGNIS